MMNRNRLPYCPPDTGLGGAFDNTLLPSFTPLPSSTPLPSITPLPSFTPLPFNDGPLEDPPPRSPTFPLLVLVLVLSHLVSLFSLLHQANPLLQVVQANPLLQVLDHLVPQLHQQQQPVQRQVLLRRVLVPLLQFLLVPIVFWSNLTLRLVSLLEQISENQHKRNSMGLWRQHQCSIQMSSQRHTLTSTRLKRSLSLPTSGRAMLCQSSLNLMQMPSFQLALPRAQVKSSQLWKRQTTRVSEIKVDYLFRV